MTTTEGLIVFTRYPEAGKTKTRLIPALGAEGAAKLQRQMTEHTIAHVQQLQRSRSLNAEVRFAGGNLALMQQWLGTHLNYQPQGEGDLGKRMATAFHTAFASGIERVVTIGIDCPELNCDRLTQAFTALSETDLVLGTAKDGGYYLIGLRRFIPDLFIGVDWGTEVVLSQTLEIAQRLNLAVTLLDPLADIDRPEDLHLWQAVKDRTVSVIIPVLNEESQIKAVLTSVQSTPDVEVIVVDGGSQDQTSAIAQSMGATVIHSPPGRATQMNRGAVAAIGETLLFLHADTHLPEDFVTVVRQTLTQPNTIAGAFTLTIAGKAPGLRWVEWGVKWRSRLWQLPYGDQAIFLKRSVFEAIGGYPELPIMEDFEFVRRLRRLGKVAIAPEPVLTSGRRWQTLGILRTTIINQWIILAYSFKVSPDRLARWYRRSTQVKRTLD